MRYPCGHIVSSCPECGRPFTEPRESLLEALYKANGPVFGSVLHELIGASRRQTYYMLNDLIEVGIVEKVGTDDQRRGYRLSALTRTQMRQVREVARRTL